MHRNFKKRTEKLGSNRRELHGATLGEGPVEVHARTDRVESATVDLEDAREQLLGTFDDTIVDA